MNSNGHIIKLTVTTSTNNYTSELLRQSVIHDWTTVVAAYQESGRGQRQKSWHSEPGENLLSSTYRKLDLPVTEQFFVSAASALAVCDLLRAEGLEALIKWPNDILIKDQKVAGLLIENQVSNQLIEQSIIGIGLNVNQRSFPEFPWAATSMSLETNLVYDLDRVLTGLRTAMHSRMSQTFEEIRQEYEKRLYGRSRECLVMSKDAPLQGILKGVSADGELILLVLGKDLYLGDASIRSIGNGSASSSPGN